MSDDTRTFKLAKMKDMSVIYPHPVKKGEKYLIQPNHNLGDTELQVLVSALIIADTPDDRLEALNDFKKRLEAQNQCSACQEMGILSPKLHDWIRSLFLNYSGISDV